MRNPQVVKNQIEALENVRVSLTKSQEMIREAQRSYQKAMRDAFANGVDQNILQAYYTDYLATNEKALDAVVKRMEHADIPFIKRKIEGFKQIEATK